MSCTHKTLVTFLSIAVLASAGCASRPASQTSASRNCIQPAACAGPSQNGVHGYQDLSAQNTNSRDLSLPPASLGTVDALVQSPDVRAALARSSAAYSEIDMARSMRRPQASLDASGSVLSGKRDPFAGDEPNNAYSYGVTVNLPLYQGGRDKAALGVALSEFRASVESARDVLLSTSLELVSAQAQVRRQVETLAVLEKHRRALKVLRGNVVGERDAGTATAVDIGEVDRQLLRIKVEQKQAQLQRAEAERTLTRLNAPGNLRADAPLLAISEKLPQQLPDLVALALKNNPRIATRVAQMDAAGARVDQARSAYNPNLSLSLSAALDETPSNSTDVYKEAKALFRLSVPLYSGGAREAGIQGRNADFLASALEKDSAVMGVYAAVSAAFERRNFAVQMLALARQELVVSRTQIASVKAERKLGERSVFDEIRAISDTASAELDVNTAIYELALSEYILASETGMLDDIIGVKLDVAHDATKTGDPAATRG